MPEAVGLMRRDSGRDGSGSGGDENVGLETGVEVRGARREGMDGGGEEAVLGNRTLVAGRRRAWKSE